MTSTLDPEPLGGWLAVNVPEAAGPVRVEPLSGGASNLTFRARDDANDWVLRHPPLSHVLATAHDVGREYRVQQALAGTDVPVPRMVAFCDDPAVIGAPFYVMEHLDGIVYADAGDVAHLTEADARDATDELVDVLARLHAVDAEAVGLGDLGKPDGFLERQLRRWRTQWEKSSPRSVPAIEEVAGRLDRALPRVRAQPAAIVHGDYSFNNTMYSRSQPGRMVALLDWEMSTLGDPLTDLGLLVTYWGPVGELLWRTRAPQPHRANPGFPAVDVLIERYASASGRQPDDLGFYRVLAIYKLAVIAAGAAARGVDRDPERARATNSLVDELASMALEV